MVKIFKLITFLFCLSLILISCGNKYYYVRGGPRPRVNSFKVSKLVNAGGVQIIDTTSIYLNKKSNWFYKFHSDNKVGYFYLEDGDLSLLQGMTSDDGKMGYYEEEEMSLTIFLFIKNDLAFFKKEKLEIGQDTIFDNTGFYVKTRIEDNSNLQPNW
jgi:hypothetical protein